MNSERARGAIALETTGVKIAEAFSPSAPIKRQEFFASRWSLVHRLNQAVFQAGLHAVLYGERGVGKTSLANIVKPLLAIRDEDQRRRGPARVMVQVNAAETDSFYSLWRKALLRVSITQTLPAFGLNQTATSATTDAASFLGQEDAGVADRLIQILSQLDDAVFVFDEFDRLARVHSIAFTDLLKACSDYSISATIVIVGVADTLDNLVSNHESIRRSIDEIHVERWSRDELAKIVTDASAKIGIAYSKEAITRIVATSQGLPHYTHLLGRHAAMAALSRKSATVEMVDVMAAFSEAVKGASGTTNRLYKQGVQSPRKDALYQQVLLACAIAATSSADADGYFQAADVASALSRVLGQASLTVDRCSRQINAFVSNERGPMLIKRGMKRFFRYRFVDPLMPPFVLMKGIDSRLIRPEELWDSQADPAPRAER